MNLLGITWGMGARDVGMKAAVDSAQTGLNNLNDGLEKQSKIASKSKMSGFFDGIKNSVKNFNIASIASDVSSLTGDTGNLSNSLESMAVANAKAAAPFVAAMNLSADAARKMTGRISGMAIGMNVGAESVAKVYTEFNRMTPAAKETAKALGMTEKDFVKFTETTGVSVSDLNASITDLTGSWNMAPKSVAKFLNSMTELGKKTGLGMTPIAGMKENLQALDDTFEKLPPGMQRTGDEITALMESSVRLAGAFAAQGASQEDAMKMGADTAKMFAEQSTQIERLMKTGFGADSIEAASPLIKYLTGLGIGFDEAKGIIDTGSRDTVKGVQAMQAAFTKYNVTGAQQQAMLSGLSESMGESVKGLGYLASGGDAATAKLKEMSDVTVTGKDTLKAYGDQAFRSGRTLQDSYNLAKDAFDTQIRSISRADVQGLIGSKMGAFREVGKEIKAMASEDGPMGMLVRGMSTFKQMGMGGVFLQVGKAMGMNVQAAQKMSVKFGLVFDTLQDLGKELGPVMNLLGQFGPMGIAAGGIAGFFMLGDAERNKIWQTIAPIWELVKTGAIKAWDNFQTWFVGAWERTSNWLANNWDGLWEKKILPTIMKLIEWFSKPGGIGEKLLSAMQDVFGKVWDEFGIGGVVAIAGFVTVATGQGGAIGSAMGSAVGNAVGGAAKLALENIPWAAMFSPAGLIGMAVIAGLAGIGVLIKMDMDRMAEDLKKKQDKVKEVGNAIENKIRQDVAGVSEVTKALEGIVSPEERQAKFNELVRSGKLVPEKFDVKRKTEGELSPVFAKMEGEFKGARESDASAVANSQGSGRDLNLSTVGQIDQAKIDAAMAKVKQLSSLPAVQQQLSAMAGKSADDIWVTVSNIAAMYDKLNPQRVQELLLEANEVSQMASKSIGAGVVEEMSFIGDELYSGGQSLMGEFGDGIQSEDSMAGVGEAAGVVAEKSRGFFIGNSPPLEGPLAGTPGNNPMYWAGQGIMEEFAAGIENGTSVVTDAVSRALDESVIATFDTYKAKMEEIAKKKSLLQDVANMMVRDFGKEGSIVNTITVDDQTEDVRGTMKAMMSVPGLAGVTAAIINESAKQRQILDKIRGFTQVIAESDLVAKGKAPTATYTLGG
jgi:hypothetical protein